MAKIESTLFNEIRGKLKHLEFRVRKNGTIELSMKRIPAYTRTAAQDKIRTRYGQLVEQWKKLSETEKQQYEEQARRYAISGWNYYVMIKMPVQPLIFDNDGGGAWYRYVNVPITTAPSEYAQYKVVFNGDTIEVYSADGTLKTSGTGMPDFWNNVKSDGTDIRVFDENKNQLYFFVETWDYANQQAIIWVNLPANAQELNIAYGNPNALQSTYNNPDQVFEFFDDFNNATDFNNNWTVVSGTWTLDETNSLIWEDSATVSRIKTIFTDSQNYIYELKAKHDETGQLDWLGIEIKSPNTDVASYDIGYLVLHYEGLTSLKIFRADNGALTELTTATVSVGQGNWFIIRIEYENGTIRGYMNGALQWTISDTTYQSGEVIRIYNNDGALRSSYDWVRVIKFTDPAQFGTPTIIIIQ